MEIRFSFKQLAYPGGLMKYFLDIYTFEWVEEEKKRKNEASNNYTMDNNEQIMKILKAKVDRLNKAF